MSSTTQDAGSQPNDARSEAAAALFGNSGHYAAFYRTLDPAKLFSLGVDFYSAMFDIAAGRSDRAPDPKDWRFRDKAWTENPFYKRLVQAYLAMCDAAEAMIPADLPLEDRVRAELATSIATSTFAPTNSLFGNPAAMARTIETGGSNLAKGFRAFLKDMGENQGLPRQVDDSGFEVGRNLAVTPGKIVHRTEMFELIHYTPSTEQVREIPVLLVPPQIGRFYFTDLAPGRSFAEHAVAQGLQYFAISWRNPSPDERAFGLENYADAAVEALEATYAQIGVNPSSSTPRWGQELNLPGLRSQKLKRYPYLVFFMAREDHVDVWRILHAQRDIPSWLQDSEED